MPTPIAQSKIFAFSPPSPCAVSVTLARTFSKMRGAPPMKVGLMTPRFSTILVRSPSTAVLKPNSSCTADEHLAQHVGHRQPEVLHVVGTEDVERGDGLALVRPSCRAPAAHPWAGRWCPRCRSGWPGPRDRSRRSGCRPRSARSASSAAPRGSSSSRVRTLTRSCRCTSASVPSNSTMARRSRQVGGPAPCWPARRPRRTSPRIRSRPGCRRHPRAAVVGYTVVVAPPAHRIARSDRIHSMRVVEAIATRCWGWTTEIDQAGGQVEHPILGLRPGQRLPVVADPVTECLAVAGSCRPDPRKGGRTTGLARSTLRSCASSSLTGRRHCRDTWSGALPQSGLATDFTWRSVTPVALGSTAPVKSSRDRPGTDADLSAAG